jgi:hypothetical protein
VGPYPYDDLLFNPQVPCRYTLQKKKDYFRHFTRYFHEQDAFLKAEGISLEAYDEVRK